MRFAGLVLALAAMVFALQDFFQRTRGMIAADRATRDELARVVDDHLKRGAARGAPPSTQEVAHARDLARAWRKDRIDSERIFFASASRLSDYLLPAHRRPAVDGLAAQRDELEQLLVQLPPELKSFAGASPERLGLKVPSLTRGLPEDETQLLDQVAHATALVRILTAARTVRDIADASLSLERREGDSFVVKVGGQAGLGDAISFYEQVLGYSEDAPPRRLESFTLRRVPATEWGTAARRLNAPPIEFELRVGFEAPAAARGAGDGAAK